jgi:hypothetical protein
VLQLVPKDIMCPDSAGWCCCMHGVLVCVSSLWCHSVASICNVHVGVWVWVWVWVGGGGLGKLGASWESKVC